MEQRLPHDEVRVRRDVSGLRVAATAAPASAASERVEALDALRGMAILLVVAGHAIQWTYPDFDRVALFRLIYSFHMPLFFFISGVVSARSLRRPLAAQLRAKSVGLLLPFVSWSAVQFAVVRWRGGPPIASGLLSLYRSPDAGLWFLWVLFVVTLVAAAAWRLAPRAPWIGLAVAAVLLWIAPVPVLGVGLARWYFPFFAAGLLASRRVLSSAEGRGGVVRTGALALVWLALALGWRRAGLTAPVAYAAETGLPFPVASDLAYRYVTSAAGIAASLGGMPLLAAGPRLNRGLAYLGRQTLEIYVGHQTVLALFTWPSLLWAPVAGVAALTGALIAAVALKRVPFLRLVLYGGRPLAGPGPKVPRDE